MSEVGRPSSEKAKQHPLYGQLNGEVPWLDGCQEYSRETCLDCPVLLEQCPAQNPRLHKGGRPKGSGNQKESVG